MRLNLNRMLQTKLGSDPEFFIADDKTGKLILPTKITAGTKQKPEFTDSGIGIQADGFALELNLIPFFTRKASKATVAQQISHQMNEVYSFVKGRIGKRFSFLTDKVLVIDEETFESAPDVTKALGCSPDFNALANGEENPVPEPFHPRFRTTAGHITIGFFSKAGTFDARPFELKSPLFHKEVCVQVVKTIVKNGGVGLVTDPDDLDNENLRRTLYGKDGAFRPTHFGVEWRAPSNYWVFDAWKGKGDVLFNLLDRI